MTQTHQPHVIFSFNKPLLDEDKYNKVGDSIYNIKHEIIKLVNEIQTLQDKDPTGKHEFDDHAADRDRVNAHISQMLHNSKRTAQAARTTIMNRLRNTSDAKKIDLKLRGMENNDDFWCIVNHGSAWERFNEYTTLLDNFKNDVTKLIHEQQVEILDETWESLDALNEVIELNLEFNDIGDKHKTSKQVIDQKGMQISKLQKELCLKRMENWLVILGDNSNRKDLTFFPSEKLFPPEVSVQHYFVWPDLEELDTNYSKYKEIFEYKLDADFPSRLNAANFDNIMHQLTDYWKKRTQRVPYLRISDVEYKQLPYYERDIITRNNEAYQYHFQIFREVLKHLKAEHPTDTFLHSQINNISTAPAILRKEYHLTTAWTLGVHDFDKGTIKIEIYPSCSNVEKQEIYSLQPDLDSDLYMLSNTRKTLNGLLQRVYSYTMHIDIQLSGPTVQNYHCDHYMEMTPYNESSYEFWFENEEVGKKPIVSTGEVMIPGHYNGVRYPFNEITLMRMLSQKIKDLKLQDIPTTYQDIPVQNSDDPRYWHDFWESCPVLLEQWSQYNIGFLSLSIKNKLGQPHRKFSVLVRYTCPNQKPKIKPLQLPHNPNKDQVEQAEKQKKIYENKKIRDKQNAYIKRKNPIRRIQLRDDTTKYTFNEHVYICRVTPEADVDIPSLLQLQLGMHQMQDFVDDYADLQQNFNSNVPDFSDLDPDANEREKIYKTDQSDRNTKDRIEKVDICTHTDLEYQDWASFVRYFQARRIAIENEVVKTMPPEVEFYKLRKHIALTTYVDANNTKDKPENGMFTNKGVFRAYLRRFHDAQQKWSTLWKSEINHNLHKHYPEPDLYTYIYVPAKQPQNDLIYWYRDFMLDDAYKMPLEVFGTDTDPRVQRELVACNIVWMTFQQLQYHKDMNMRKLMSNFVYTLIYANPYISRAFFWYIVCQVFNHVKNDVKKLQNNDEMTNILRQIFDQVSSLTAQDENPIAEYADKPIDYSHYVMFCNTYLINRWDWSCRSHFVATRGKKYDWIPQIDGACYAGDVTPPNNLRSLHGNTCNIFGASDGGPDDRWFIILPKSNPKDPDEISWRPWDVHEPNWDISTFNPYAWGSAGMKPTVKPVRQPPRQQPPRQQPPRQQPARQQPQRQQPPRQQPPRQQQEHEQPQIQSSYKMTPCDEDEEDQFITQNLTGKDKDSKLIETRWKYSIDKSILKYHDKSQTSKICITGQGFTILKYVGMFDPTFKINGPEIVSLDEIHMKIEESHADPSNLPFYDLVHKFNIECQKHDIQVDFKRYPIVWCSIMQFLKDIHVSNHLHEIHVPLVHALVNLGQYLTSHFVQHENYYQLKNVFIELKHFIYGDQNQVLKLHFRSPTPIVNTSDFDVATQAHLLTDSLQLFTKIIKGEMWYQNGSRENKQIPYEGVAFDDMDIILSLKANLRTCNYAFHLFFQRFGKEYMQYLKKIFHNNEKRIMIKLSKLAELFVSTFIMCKPDITESQYIELLNSLTKMIEAKFDPTFLLEDSFDDIVKKFVQDEEEKTKHATKTQIAEKNLQFIRTHKLQQKFPGLCAYINQTRALLKQQ